VQIDWLTVTAQIVNFLVLVWLLQRFLYKPITSAMRRRETRIEERLAEARKTREEAEDEVKHLKRQQADLEADRAAILEAARDEAGQLRARLEAQIRDEMEERRKIWSDHLAEGRDAIVASLQRQAGHQIFEITRRVLADYADSDLADRVVSTFVQRLDTLDDATRGKMTETAAQEGERALIETGAVLDSAAKARITRAVHRVLSTDLEVAYGEDPDLVLGVRLTLGDHSVEWSAMRYLDRLQVELGELIDASSQAAGQMRHGPETDARGPA
jgi:F-type H+-transporting ATPase subunit b